MVAAARVASAGVHHPSDAAKLLASAAAADRAVLKRQQYRDAVRGARMRRLEKAREHARRVAAANARLKKDTDRMRKWTISLPAGKKKKVSWSKTASVKVAGKQSVRRALCLSPTCSGRVVYAHGSLFCLPCKSKRSSQ